MKSASSGKGDDEVACVKVFDEKSGDVVFEGKVSTDVAPNELVRLGCFQERYFCAFHIKTTKELLVTLKGVQSVELIGCQSCCKQVT